MGQSKSLKQIFCKIEGQFDCESQSQVTVFFKINPRPLDDQYTAQV